MSIRRPEPAAFAITVVEEYVPCFVIVPPGPNPHERSAELSEMSKGKHNEKRSVIIGDDVVNVKRGGVDMPQLTKRYINEKCGIGINFLVVKTAWTREDVLAVREAAKMLLETTGDNLKLNHNKWWEFIYDLHECASKFLGDWKK